MNGLYIHIPFCIKKCLYCDFCSYPIDQGADEYINKLLGEIENPSEYFTSELIFDTVYFGGGTPSLLSVQQFERIFEAIRKHYKIVNGAEVTVEVNPAAVDRLKLIKLNNLGVNRLSVGMQSMNETILKSIGRLHTPYDFLQTIDWGRDAGFVNISADVMIGLPGQGLRDVLDSLKAVSDLEHVSVYSLKIEENTPIAAMDFTYPADEEEREMYETAVYTLNSHGICQYEVSNFARAGYTSRHNTKYWTGENYLGLGLSAHSYCNGIRFHHLKDMSQYPNDVVAKTVDDLEFEFMMLRLRLNNGIRFAEYKEKFSANFQEMYAAAIEKACAYELITRDEWGIYPTLKGFNLQNQLVLLFDVDNNTPSYYNK